MSEFAGTPPDNAIMEWVKLERRKQPKVRRVKFSAPANKVFLRSSIYNLPIHAFDDTHVPELGVIDPPVMSRESSIGSVGSGHTCLTCKLVFMDWTEQHEHFKTDLHRFNARGKLHGRPPLTTEEFLEQKKSKSKSAAPSVRKGPRGEDSDASEHSVESSEISADESDSDADHNLAKTAHSNVVEDESYVSESFEQERDASRHMYQDSRGTIRKLFNNASGPYFVVQPAHTHPWQFTVPLAIFTTSSPFSKRDWVFEKQLWQNLREDLKFIQSKPMIAVFALRSGRFAGAIFDNNAKNPLVAHKVIRRYTVRAKAGGSQSSHDSKHGKARSMGAQLRRYGEQALQEDVQKLLTIWQDYLNLCGLILIATTKATRSHLFDLPNASNANHLVLLDRNDPRIVYVPFTVDRPTMEAVQVIRDRALQVIVADHSLLPEDNASATPDDYDEENVNCKSDGGDGGDEDDESVEGTEGMEGMEGMREGLMKKRLEKLRLETIKSDMAAEEAAIKAERAAREAQLLNNPMSKKIVEAVASGDDKVALAVVQEVASLFNISSFGPPPLPREVGEDYNAEAEAEAEADAEAEEVLAQPRLMREFSQDLADILQLPEDIEALSSPLHLAVASDLQHTVMALLRFGANPEQLDARGRTPYFLATSKEMREVFRRARGELGEERWKWSKTGVPEPITNESIALQKAKDKEKKKRAAQRKKEQKIKADQEAADAQFARKLQEEMKEAMLREQEENLKALAGSCVMCGKGLYKHEIISVSDHKCCSGACVIKLRRQLAADAASARFAAQQMKGDNA